MEPVVSVTTHLGRPLTYLRLVFLLLGAALAVALSVLDATLVVIAAQYLSGIPLVAVAVVIVVFPSPSRCWSRRSARSRAWPRSRCSASSSRTVPPARPAAGGTAPGHRLVPAARR